MKYRFLLEFIDENANNVCATDVCVYGKSIYTICERVVAEYPDAYSIKILGRVY